MSLIEKSEKVLGKIHQIIKGKKKKEDKLSQILKLIVDHANIDQDKYYLLGSYAIRKHRTINDLDINMEKLEWDKLRAAFPTPNDKNFPWKTEWYGDQWRWFIELTPYYRKHVDKNEKDFSIEMFRKEKTSGFPDNTFSLSYLRRNKGLDRDKNGHQHFKLKTLLRWKKTMNREKDQKDIELIKSIMK